MATLVLATLTVRSGSARALTADDVRADGDWILGAQLPDGAIANYSDRAAIWPYLSNFAALGLVRATEVTGDAKYLDAVWRWLGWYQAHMDATGFVTDYIVTGGVATSTGAMDSTDSYAGTFLLATKAAYQARPGQLAKLQALATGVDKAVRAIEATRDADGLTWAKPTWKVKYLMDQAEAYAGLMAAGDLASALGNTTLATRARDDATRMKAGVAELWNTGVLAYDWAKHESGVRVRNQWPVLYSDSLQQAWAVAFGLVASDRAGGLVNSFAAAQPNWAFPDALALFDSGNQERVGYWPVAGLAFRDVGLLTTATNAAMSIRTAAVGAGRPWPFTTGNAGQLILLESYAVPQWASAATTTTSAKPTTTTTQKPAKAKTTTTRPRTTTTAKPTTTTRVTTTTTTTAPLLPVPTLTTLVP